MLGLPGTRSPVGSSSNELTTCRLIAPRIRHACELLDGPEKEESAAEGLGHIPCNGNGKGGVKITQNISRTNWRSGAAARKEKRACQRQTDRQTDRRSLQSKTSSERERKRERERRNEMASLFS